MNLIEQHKNTISRLYQDLSQEFIRRGVGSNDFAKLTDLYNKALYGVELGRLESKAKLDTATKALEPYADPEAWDHHGDFREQNVFHNPDDIKEIGFNEFKGGEIARQALKEIKEQQ